MKYIGLFLLLIPMLTIGQNADTTKLHKKSIGVLFSPDYSFRTLASFNSSSAKWIIAYRDSLEVPNFGYTTGVNFTLSINSSMSLETGFLFSKKGYQSKTYTPVWVLPTNTPDPLLPMLPSDFHYTDHFYYLDVPVKLNYYFLNQNVKFFVTAGLSTNFFLVQKFQSSYVTSSGELIMNSTTNDADYSKINMAGLLGFGLEYDFTKSLQLRMEPLFRHSITAIANTPVKGYLWSIGLNTGVFFRF